MIVLLVAVASVATGFAIGCIPVVQEHLHWNLWFIVPVSGLILGFALGWLQFIGSFVSGTKLTNKVVLFFSIVTVTAYLATEVGTYATLKAPVTGVFGLSYGEQRISTFISFPEYMSNRLGGATLQGTRGAIEMGATATRISFVVDLLGAGLGTVLTLLVLGSLHPFCDRCRVYKKRHHLYNIRPAPDETTLRGIFDSIAELTRKQDHRELVKLLKTLEATHQDKKSLFRIAADERFCPKCREATVLGKVSRQEGKEWKPITDLAFSTTSGVGVHGS
jgi:hypothetical protein